MLTLLPALWLASAPGCQGGVAPDLEVTSHRVLARDVTLRVEDGVGRLSLTDRLRPEGPGAALTSYLLELPPGRGVVVDAWLSSARGKVPSTLLLADVADAELDAFERALIRGWGAEPPDRLAQGKPQGALLARHGSQGVEVRVVAPCGLGDVRVHLQVALASDPVDDELRFELPTTQGVSVRRMKVPGRFWRPLGPEAVLVERRDEEARGRVSVSPLEEIEGRHLVRAELDLPRRFVEERPLAIVFVLDHSASFGAERLAAATALIERVLADAPAGSRYAVVGMARRAHVAVPWTAAEERASLRAVADPGTLANGSDLVAALELAKRLAADAGERDGRVIVLSDLEVASAVPDAAVLVALAAGQAITHAVQVWGEGSSSWERTFAEDGTRLAAGPEATGGVLVEASLLLEEPDPALAAYLLRPTRLERPRIVAARGEEVLLDSSLTPLERRDWRAPWLAVEGARSDEGIESSVPAHLREGRGLRATGLFRPLGSTDTWGWRVEGLLWGTRARYPLSVTPATQRLLPALSAVNAVSDELDDEAVLSLSRQSGAVSRVASRLALPAWRPAWRDDSYGFGCSCGGGSISGFGTHGASCRSCGGREPAYDQAAELERWLAGAHSACGDSDQTLWVEWGRHEVLDVAPTGAFGPVERCYAEALWQLRLDVEPTVTSAAFESKGAVTVRLPGA